MFEHHNNNLMEENILKNKRVIIPILSIISALEVGFIIRGIFVFDFTDARHLLYFISYLVLLFASLGSIIATRYARQSSPISLKRAYYCAYFYVFVMCLWTLLITYLDMLHHNPPLVFLTVFMGIPAFLSVKPQFYAPLVVLSTIAVIIFNTIIEQTFDNGFAINMGVYGLITSYIAYKTYKLSLSQYNSRKDLEKLTITDQLTTLLNRRALDEKINQILNEDFGCHLVLLDIDHFKKINDTFGHVTGDECLVLVANTLKEHFGQYHSYRYGGDEFAIITDIDKELILEKLEQCNKKLLASSTDWQLRLSYGVCHIQATDTSSLELFNRADKLLYEAKTHHLENKGNSSK